MKQKFLHFHFSFRLSMSDSVEAVVFATMSLFSFLCDELR